MPKEKRSDPKDHAMEVNLQSFANGIGIICALEAGGKITPQEAYKQVKVLWKQLKKTKKSLYPKEKLAPALATDDIDSEEDGD
ncbi:MAG: hypothetical protein V4655_00210 [Bdellovibrionota bacterium]